MLTALLVAALSGPGEISAETFRQAYQLTMAVPVRTPDQDISQSVFLYRHLDSQAGLTRHERDRMRRGLGARLSGQLQRLQRLGRRSQSRGGSPGPEEHLIRLIVTTIAPQSWQVNGGPGSISYYSIRPALVVRQTDEVHAELRSLLQALDQGTR